MTQMTDWRMERKEVAGTLTAAEVQTSDSLKKLFPEFRINKNNFLDKLAGSDMLRIMLSNGSSYEEITGSYSGQLSDFKEKRKKYLLYK